MRRFVGVFSVSVIAIMAACNAFAATSDVSDSNIASVGYVDKKVVTAANYAANANSDTLVPSILTAKQIAGAAAGAMVEKNQGPQNPNKVMTTNKDGKVGAHNITGTGATTVSMNDNGDITIKSTVTTAGDGNVVTVGAGANGVITLTKGITAEETKNKTTTIRDVTEADDTKYPTEKAVTTLVQEVVDAISEDSENQARRIIEAEEAIKNITAQASNYQTKANLVKEANIDWGTESAADDDDKYPSVAAVRPIAVALDETIQNVDTLGSVVVWRPEGKGVGDSTHPVYVAADGSVTKIDKVAGAATADSATKATRDGNGKVIADTYQTKGNMVKDAEVDWLNESLPKANEIYPSIATMQPAMVALNDTIKYVEALQDNALTGVAGGEAATGKVVTSVTRNGTNVAATMDFVKIPVGSATAPTSVASIWVE